MCSLARYSVFIFIINCFPYNWVLCASAVRLIARAQNRIKKKEKKKKVGPVGPKEHGNTDEMSD